MKSKRAVICVIVFGAFFGMFFLCGAAVAGEGPSPNLFTYLTPRTAYGAVLGLIGLLIQLRLRGAWPTGRLNEGRPNVLDPSTFVLAVFAAIAAGIAATIAFDAEINNALDAAKTAANGLEAAKVKAAAAAAAKDADGAAAAAKDAAAASAVPTATAVRLKYGLAIVVFGYVAADLGATALEKIWEGLQTITAPIQALWKRLTGSK
jgi:hypothetical protein